MLLHEELIQRLQSFREKIERQTMDKESWYVVAEWVKKDWRSRSCLQSEPRSFKIVTTSIITITRISDQNKL